MFHHIMDEDGHYDPFRHMAQIVGLLGNPPKEFVSRSETTDQCFDTNGESECDRLYLSNFIISCF